MKEALQAVSFVGAVAATMMLSMPWLQKFNGWYVAWVKAF